MPWRHQPHRANGAAGQRPGRPREARMLRWRQRSGGGAAGQVVCLSQLGLHRSDPSRGQSPPPGATGRLVQPIAPGFQPRHPPGSRRSTGAPRRDRPLRRGGPKVSASGRCPWSLGRSRPRGSRAGEAPGLTTSPVQLHGRFPQPLRAAKGAGVAPATEPRAQGQGRPLGHRPVAVSFRHRSVIILGSSVELELWLNDQR